MSRATSIVMAAVLVVSIASAAEAQSADEARQLFEQGLSEFDAGELGRAEELFRRSLAIRRSGAAVFNLGRVLEQIGELAEARELFVEVAQIEGVPGPIRDQARARVQELDLRVARLTVRCENPAAEVRIDGSAVPVGVERRVDPGDHQVTVRFGDQVLLDESIHLAEGETRTLRAAAPAPQPEPTPVAPGPSPSEPSDGGDDTVIWVVIVSVAVAALIGGGIALGVALSPSGCDAGNVLDECIAVGP